MQCHTETLQCHTGPVVASVVTGVTIPPCFSHLFIFFVTCVGVSFAQMWPS